MDWGCEAGSTASDWPSSNETTPIGFRTNGVSSTTWVQQQRQSSPPPEPPSLAEPPASSHVAGERSSQANSSAPVSRSRNAAIVRRTTGQSLILFSMLAQLIVGKPQSPGACSDKGWYAKLA